MKIVIKNKERKRPIKIPVPLSLVTVSLRVSKPLIYRVARKEDDEKLKKILDCINFDLLCRSIKDLKGFKGLNIVEIKEKSGTEIKITV
ncbi:hypothetical protein [Clostridium hydrogeniformans]|uniref:hypothetical protein n=1 Tax=Clostridium hydrogeniformans TaxID=349933 RepID=UPI00048A2530|nr:hypothetical protein [Clostridium hydrogeniformans]